MKQAISQRIKSIRVEQGLSQSIFAEMLGIKQASLSDIERGKTEVNYILLSELSTKFAVNLNWLITGEGDKKNGYYDNFDRKDKMSEINLANEITKNLREIRFYKHKVLDIDELLWIAINKRLDFENLEDYLRKSGLILYNNDGTDYYTLLDFQKRIIYNEDLKQTKVYLQNMFFDKFKMLYRILSDTKVCGIVKKELNRILLKETKKEK